MWVDGMTTRQRISSRLPSAVKPAVRMPSDRATTVEHLEELRWRIISTVALFIVCFGVALTFRSRLFSILDRPLDGRFELVTLSVTEPLFTTLWIAIYFAAVTTLPFALWQLWRFIKPALDSGQRRAVMLPLLLSPLLFGAGATFCYFTILGPAVQFLLAFGADAFEVQVRASEYYGFITTMTIGLGAIFCFPLMIIALARLDLVTATTLRKSRRVALVFMAVVAALLPTADPFSLALEILPLVMLYELTIIVIALMDRKKAA